MSASIENLIASMWLLFRTLALAHLLFQVGLLQTLQDVRIALEDLNKLVSVHIQRCVQKYNPSVIVEDLRGLLQTGFASLNHTIHSVPDERLIPHLVQMWLFVFGPFFLLSRQSFSLSTSNLKVAAQS